MMPYGLHLFPGSFIFLGTIKNLKASWREEFEEYKHTFPTLWSDMSMIFVLPLTDDNSDDGAVQSADVISVLNDLQDDSCCTIHAKVQV